MNTLLYVCQLSQSSQDYIKESVLKTLSDYTQEEQMEIIENVMSDRICNVVEIINMKKCEVSQ